MKKVVFIGLVWPEPSSTAAGRRILRLIQLFRESKYEVVFLSAADFSERSHDLEQEGCNVSKIELNNSNFNDQIKSLTPDVVIYDRFITEEQFGWRVDEVAPNAIKILDTEDLHFLRIAREKAFKNGLPIDLKNEIAKRELASILRCDLSLIISEFEYDLLINEFNIGEELLCYLPFQVLNDELAEISDLPTFKERNGFMTIGNFRHAPNMDSVKFLRKAIWSGIRQKLPDVKMNVYGSYVTENALSWNNSKDGFLLHGTIPHAMLAFTKARVCLSPLRFGAGLKGKFLEAMICGTPIVTTSVGAEGMSLNGEWCGIKADSEEELIKAAVKLYADQGLWKEKQRIGFEILKEKFATPTYETEFMNTLEKLELLIENHRSKNFTGEILRFHSMRSTEYLSRWIEEKNRNS